jgi:hypothetical protein
MAQNGREISADAGETNKPEAKVHPYDFGSRRNTRDVNKTPGNMQHHDQVPRRTLTVPLKV